MNTDIYTQAQQLGRLANEAGVAMAHASGSGQDGGHFRAFVEVSTDLIIFKI